MASHYAELLTTPPYQEITHPDGINIRVFESSDLTAQGAAHHILIVPKYKPEAAITFATGKTMEPVYDFVQKISKARRISFKSIKARHLDEYWPCNPDNPDGFVYYLNQRVFIPLGIPLANRHIINGLTADPEDEMRKYEEELAKTGTDLAILGIGPGGHIGFNERGTPFAQRSYLAPLSEETIARDIQRGAYVSDQALTQGIGTILDAKKIILVAYGEEKGRYLAEALYGEISPNCPASALRTVGHKVTIFVDQEAANVILRARDWKIQESID